MATRKIKAADDDYDYKPVRRKRRTAVRVTKTERQRKKEKVVEAYYAGRDFADAVFNIVNLFL